MASSVDLEDRFDISGPTHIMSRAGGTGRSSPTTIDWYVVGSALVHAYKCIN